MVLLATIYLSNLTLLWSGFWYQLTFVAQVAFYLLALLGWLFRERLTSPIFYLPYYFTAVNWAALLGLLNYLTGRQKVTWERGRE